MHYHIFLSSINFIFSFAHLYNIPLLILISYLFSFLELYPFHT